MNTPIVAPSSSGTMPSISNTPIISSTSSISNSSGLLSSDSSSSILNESESFLIKTAKTRVISLLVD